MDGWPWLTSVSYREYEELHYAGIRSYTSIFPWGGRQMPCAKNEPADYKRHGRGDLKLGDR